eukprot:6149936-Amphidinium_carterae.1
MEVATQQYPNLSHCQISVPSGHKRHASTFKDLPSLTTFGCSLMNKRWCGHIGFAVRQVLRQGNFTPATFKCFNSTWMTSAAWCDEKCHLAAGGPDMECKQ